MNFSRTLLFNLQKTIKQSVICYTPVFDGTYFGMALSVRPYTFSFPACDHHILVPRSTPTPCAVTFSWWRDCVPQWLG